MTARPLREALIDVDAIEHNVRHLRRLVQTEVIAVVKAGGYGHGALLAATAALAGGATRLGVADVSEALALRGAGITAPVVAWLHGSDADFRDAAEHGIELGISSLAQLQAAAAAASAEQPVGVHLKVETGLGRNGVEPREWQRVCAEAARLERVGRLRVVGVFSHLSNTSIDDDRRALARFHDALAEAAAAGVHPPLRHIAASNAAIALPEARLDCVRLGLAIYGLSPLADRSSAELGLQPAMTLRTSVAAVRRVPAGQGVSYGYTHRTAAETTLALVPLGYADGVPRQASGRGPVVIGGRRYTVSGRIAMDQFVVDVGDADVSIGDEVVLFGDPTLGYPAAAEWGDAADTIDYEIVTRIGPRVQRTAVSSEMTGGRR
ncbi:alanine racemase [Microbacterium arborescens]|uniref:alanine racemase n=1 Tax=Microbacterium arborescens TaxID=33883 RepID=UPI0025A22DE9|nr:alanine racemase [Microbacterium arborescens]WJM15220.1 alanine racemase [Microbacterium arborescens]